MMFTRIRNRLTLLYAALTTAFLIVFIVIFYFILSSLLLREQKQTVMNLANTQALSFHGKIEKYEKMKAGEKQPAIGNNGDDFYYLLSKDDSIIDGNEPIPSMRAGILLGVNSWKLPKTEIISIALPEGQDVKLMVSALVVADERGRFGKAIAAKDLATYDYFLHSILQILLGISLLLLLISILTGRFVAKKALIPIKTSFEKQRQFVADASHELRTPISVIQSSLDVIEKEDKAHLSILSVQILEDTKDEIRRMGRLVHNLLTLARADSGDIEIFKEHFDLRATAEYAIRSLKPIADKKNIALILLVPDQLFMYADKDRLAQLLFLFLDNGIKYTPDGGQVSLSINLTMQKNNNGIKIIVQDTGIGLASADYSRIFERFFRTDKVRSREAGGFGLGLSIASWIISAHDGTKKVTSTPGIGTVFTIFIPC